ncbi:MAG: endonuclease [Bacteroidales bacterium]|nr:endonuclease [Bacteroidales bacterium]MDT8374603.1 endonuclease [Bacteroidales bacterium]
MLKSLPTLILLFCLTSQIAGQPPEGYYNGAADLTGKALQQSLHDIIDEHTQLEYSDLWQCFSTTDIKSDGVTIWDIYSDIPGGTPVYVYTLFSGQCGNYDSEGDCYNREHSFPKSWFNDALPMYTDLFHIYPTDGWVNNKRGNLPYGETSSPSWTSTNGSMVGPSSVAGYVGAVFEPVDEYKGDLARTYFYMATRYFGEDSLWPGSDMTEGAQPKPWALVMLLDWHRADTISLKERNRNNAVYKYQGNRNPFIDEPLYAEKIWGTLNAIEETAESRVSMTLYPNPAQDYLNISISGYVCNGVVAFIYDTGGCLVMTATVDDSVTTVSTEGLPSGLYFLSVACEGQVSTGAFVVTAR